jgi:hypothetical protein
MSFLSRTRDQSLDLQHLRDELAVEALQSRRVDDALRFRADIPRAFDNCGGPGEQGISISGH